MEPETIVLRVHRLRDDVAVPSYAHPGDAGLDLAVSEAVTLAPGERVAAGTGLAIAVPDGWVGLVHPRSGLSFQHGVTLVNAPGTVDAGYRGEVKVLLVNLGDEQVELPAGTRVAQLVVQRVARAQVIEVDALDRTVRGEDGFGSSGT